VATPVAKDCASCHKKIVGRKVVHPAITYGCPTCHTALDASKVPHVKTNKTAFGLSEVQPGLCYECHDTFTGTSVHPALTLGCTSCHDPHSSPNNKLLVKKIPELCFTCHARALFTMKHVHAPVAQGKCLACHNPHATNNMALLRKNPEELCLQCHPNIGKTPHVIADSFAGEHPIGLPKKGNDTMVKDPVRLGKPFYCGSCHNPHSAVSIRLYRFKATSAYDLCGYCHKE
jgi:predicted CXXCH cytochrome family protein